MSFGTLTWSSAWDSDPNDVFLSVGAAAHLAGVSVDTIRRWCTNGRLEYRQGGPNNHRRILRSDLLALISGEASEPPLRGRGGRRRLPELLEEWSEELDELLPWTAGPLDTEQRIARLVVIVRGFGSDGGVGGLIGKLSELVGDLEAALSAYDPEGMGEPASPSPDRLIGDDVDDGAEPEYLRILRESKRRQEDWAARPASADPCPTRGFDR